MSSVLPATGDKIKKHDYWVPGAHRLETMATNGFPREFPPPATLFLSTFPSSSSLGSVGFYVQFQAVPPIQLAGSCRAGQPQCCPTTPGNYGGEDHSPPFVQRPEP